MTEKMWKTQKHMTSFNFLIAMQVHPAIKLQSCYMTFQTLITLQFYEAVHKILLPEFFHFLRFKQTKNAS